MSQPAVVRVARKAVLLFVDDDPELRTIIIEYLSAVDFEVFEAPGGTEALAILAAHPNTDMLISDIQMPGMSGIELAAAAHSLYPKLKIVLISGYADEIPSDCYFLRKPFRMNVLQKIITSELAARH